MFNSELPAKFFRLRRHLEYSQEFMGLELGISAEAYGKIERGKTNISEIRLRQVSKTFGFKPWEMLELSADELILALINRNNSAPPLHGEVNELIG
jgi:transcriptional regulator with XRE-family HTH domain